MSLATAIRTKVEKAPPGALFSLDDFAGVGSREKRGAAKVALHRLAAEGVIRRARRGIYWKSARSRFGPGRPLMADVAVKASEGKSLGPTGWLASHTLGLSTQVPASPQFVVVGAAPRSVPGVIFHTRAYPKRAGLRYEEIALLEVLRGWPRSVEGSWSDLAWAVRNLSAHGRIDLADVEKVARFERPLALRERLARLRREIEMKPSSVDDTGTASKRGS